jgi:alkanesulfonate monooxygenase SsuD/methylene tetrahydromethanopterin reductase-like flavin-dependent oxidoreductase (luciferase family)
MAPSQSVFLAAAARHTHKLLLGTMVTLLPLYHPLRLIEEICMLDNLSGGRFQMGVGRGITALEHSWWGQRPEDAQARYDETLQIIVAGLSGDAVNYKGRFYDFDNVPLELAPVQKPYPAFWYAGTPDNAARHGFHYIGRPGPRLPELTARYREVWQSSQDQPGRINAHVPEPFVGSSRHIVVADTDAEADAIARAAWPAYQGNFAKRGLTGPGPETHADGTTSPVPNGGPGTELARDFDRAKAAESALVGSPATIAAYVERYREESGANYFMASFHWGDMTHVQAMRSLELFGTEVIAKLGAEKTLVS